ncbi:hypothetical protein [Nostoc sp. LEGE 12450]|uniref:hypothetical protein n=1 Tax=Nostoc sp. LEGE 12450 TaxID=1828643 RepID=UPI001881F2C1|nr:hypothetical protein [Nostoc sp. LEGE 12450]MBE8986932.1 hypothetical protein [Nostoc sp. LEGE 12450]
MSKIAIVDLQPDNQVEEREVSEAVMAVLIGGIQVKLLGNNILDATFKGFTLTV